MARAVLTRRARRDLDQLDWQLGDAVIEALRRLEREPDAGHLLKGRLTGLRSLRIGAYRVLYVLADGEREVRVLAIRHRSIAYGSDPR